MPFILGLLVSEVQFAAAVTPRIYVCVISQLFLNVMMQMYVTTHLHGFYFSQIDKIMNSIDVGITTVNSELEEMNGENLSKDTVFCTMVNQSA